MLDDRNVERLIGDAVAIARAIGRREQEEKDAADDPGQRLPRRSLPRCSLPRRSRRAKAGIGQRPPSSALGP